MLKCVESVVVNRPLAVLLKICMVVYDMMHGQCVVRGPSRGSCNVVPGNLEEWNMTVGEMDANGLKVLVNKQNVLIYG